MSGKISEDMLDMLTNNKAPQVNSKLEKRKHHSRNRTEGTRLFNLCLATMFLHPLLEILIFIHIIKKQHQSERAVGGGIWSPAESHCSNVLIGLLKLVSLG